MSHSDDERFVPSHMIPRTANFRGGSTRDGVVAGGPRVGMPPDRVPEADDLEEFGMTLMAGIHDEGEPLGPLSGPGKWAMSEGLISELDLYGSRGQDDYGRREYVRQERTVRRAAREDYFRPPIEVGQTDRGDDEGTPGRGVRLDDRYGYEESVGVRSAARIRVLREKLDFYTRQAEKAIMQAQRAEDSRNLPAARHLDALATKFMNHAEATEREIALQEDFATRAQGRR